MRNPNDDQVLQSFYKERQSRSRAPKTHTLLQKNMSFFSNSPKLPQDENIPIPSSKYCERKSNLQQYQRNFRALTSLHIQKNQSTGLHESRNSHKTFNQKTIMKQIEQKYRRKSFYTQTSKNQKADTDTFRFTEENQHIEMYKPKLQAPRDQYSDSSRQQYEVQYSSPKFRVDFDNINSPSNVFKHESPAFSKIQKGQKVLQIDKRIGRQEQLQDQVRQLKQRINQLEKEKKRQGKFIQSVQKMRRVIDKKDQDCNLKQLWRWVKSLPNHQ